MFRSRLLKVLVPTLLLLGLRPLPALGDAPSPASGSVRVGDIAPGFRLHTFQGDPIDLAELVGKRPVLLFFWSFFCHPCQTEISAIEGLHREMGPSRLAIVGISLDGPRFDARIRPFMEQKGITFPNGYDRETGDFFEVADRYGVVGTPTSFLLDTQGRVRFIHLGRLDPEALKALVKSACDNAFCAEIAKPATPEQR